MDNLNTSDVDKTENNNLNTSNLDEPKQKIKYSDDKIDRILIGVWIGSMIIAFILFIVFIYTKSLYVFVAGIIFSLPTLVYIFLV